MIMNKTNSIPRSLSLCALVIASTRILSVLLFSFLAYLTSDPGANVFAYSLICKALCDFLCGYITARSIGNDFSLTTRVFFGVVVVIILNVAEMFAGKLIFPRQSTAFYMIPISAVSAFVGSLLVGSKKSYKKRKRRPRGK